MDEKDQRQPSRAALLQSVEKQATFAQNGDMVRAELQGNDVIEEINKLEAAKAQNQINTPNK